MQGDYRPQGALASPCQPARRRTDGYRMSWTDERIATLTKMWESGATASQIADELGGVSRNAVIGKAHRLGLKSRPSPVNAKEPKPAARAKEVEVRPPVKVKPKAPAPQPEIEPEDEGEDIAAPAAAPSQPLPDRAPDTPRVVSVGPGGFLRQGPGDQQAPIPPAPPRRLVPAKPSPDIAGKTS